MNYEQFEFFHIKGWKIKKILSYLGLSIFEREEVLKDFKTHFSTKMESV